VLLVGLGCEVNQYRFQLERAGLMQGPTLRAIGIQESGGTSRTVEVGVQIVKEMLDNAGKVKRTVMPASEIVLGLECGGSDAFSGITANPALGVAVDLLVAHGGTAILSETTEIYGAEHLLARRARNPEVGRKLLECVQWWEAFAERHGYEINNNPTPGNKAGGLTTILEKSLGAVAKAGTTTLNDVYPYAERVQERGFVFMNTPAYDLPSITAMVAGGATVVCFTTGCGSTVGCKPSPVIKIASNSPMYERMSEDMDINCGVIAEGRSSLKEMGEKIFRKIMAVASGEKTRSEIFDYGEVEFAPWQMGVML
jgi:altronate hydrolase